MSFEGYNRWRCLCGEITCSDVYETQPTTCPKCGGRFHQKQLVDQTNGGGIGDDTWRDVEYRPKFSDYVARHLYKDAEWHGPSEETTSREKISMHLFSAIKHHNDVKKGLSEVQREWGNRIQVKRIYQKDVAPKIRSIRTAGGTLRDI